jgi:cell division septation protein DedD
MATEAAATAEWQRLQNRMPDVLGSRQPDISKSDRPGRVWWRLRTGGFEDAAQATEFCSRLRAKGINCFVTAAD